MPKAFSEYYKAARTVENWRDMRARLKPLVSSATSRLMVVVGIGSNRGNRVALARAGIECLRTFSARQFESSSLWRTSPVDCPPGVDDFVNAVVAFEPLPELTPGGLLRDLKAIEQRFGRSLKSVRNAPRELDLDLLVFGSLCLAEKDLTLPHPRAARRRFVLAPAAEIVPDLVWPGTERTVAELLASLDDDDRVERIQPT